jgi:NADH:ubiquinone oxidoreductase subunit K
MRKMATLNILLGFITLFFLAMSGLFLRKEVVDQYLASPDGLQSWRYMLMRSAHGHGNLFAIIQILYGVSLPYARSRNIARIFQTMGFFLGAFAMSTLVFLEAQSKPSPIGWSLNQLCIGACISAWSIAMVWHIYGLSSQFWKGGVGTS